MDEKRFRYYAIIISVICVIIFVVQLVIPGFTEALLLDQERPLEIWRYVTSIFLHGGLSHLLFNIFALALFGSFLEGLIGSKKFLVVFFLTGILANIVSINFYGSSLGASGAIFGVIGALIMVRPFLVVFAFGLPMPIIIAGVFWVFADLVGLFIPSNVANLAHLAGIFFGLVIGAFYRDWRGRRERRRDVRLNEGFVRKWEDYYMKDI